MAHPHPNGDEAIKLKSGLLYGESGSKPVGFIGNFHKTLPHNEFGEVDPAAYQIFAAVATGGGDYETVPPGLDLEAHPPVENPAQAKFDPAIEAPKVADRLNDPQAARAQDRLSGHPGEYEMGPAPSVFSRSIAAEMAELYWMALLRDVPFSRLAQPGEVATAVADLRMEFEAALAAGEAGGLELGRDLPEADGKLDLRAETLFRCGLWDEDKGPIVSQFFLHDIAYGAQLIEQMQRPYRAKRDFLTDHETWLLAQNTGYDHHGHRYNNDNDFSSPPSAGGDPTLEEPGGPRRIRNMRDLARFVNKDALHQAYFNAALLLLNWGAKFDKGNPYVDDPDHSLKGYRRQTGFGTMGGPDILTRVSEVASRALKVVWRQKWEVHRRLRPEAFGGLLQMQKMGYGGTTRDYGLGGFCYGAAAQAVHHAHGTYFLPMAFTAGSPVHPAYGAGHATVAGACVTVLKAWFLESQTLQELFGADNPPLHPVTGARVGIVMPDEKGSKVLPVYGRGDAGKMTVEGELNKIACNVAMGRSMGGVHWRSDNTRSLRLGEQIAAVMLAEESLEYAEVRPTGHKPIWSFRSFDRKQVRIEAGQVFVNGVRKDPKQGPL